MHSTIQGIANLYETNTGLVLRAIGDFKESDHFVRPQEKTNSLNWLLGHIVSTRFFVASLVGSEKKSKWGEIYDQGKPILKNSEYPSMVELTEAWNDMANELAERFKAVNEENLIRDIPFKIPGPEQNVRGAIGFFSLHESGHMGQIAYLRRALDYDPAFG